MLNLIKGLPKTIIVTVATYIIGHFLTRPTKVYAQTGDYVDIKPFGPFSSISELVTSIIDFALAAAGLVFFAMLILGGIRYISAQGDEKSVQSARQTITHAFIGLLVVLAAFGIIKLITITLFGGALPETIF